MTDTKYSLTIHAHNIKETDHGKMHEKLDLILNLFVYWYIRGEENWHAISNTDHTICI